MFNAITIPVLFETTGSITKISPRYSYSVFSLTSEPFQMEPSRSEVTRYFDIPALITVAPGPGRELNLDPTRYRKVYTQIRQRPIKD